MKYLNIWSERSPTKILLQISHIYFIENSNLADSIKSLIKQYLDYADSQPAEISIRREGGINTWEILTFKDPSEFMTKVKELIDLEAADHE